MFLNFEDDRPEPPRVTSAISVREGVLASLVVHLLFVIALLLAPKSFFQPAEIQPLPLTAQDHPIRFITVAPRIDRSAKPTRPADASDLDRRSTTVERPPDPTNNQPFSAGNTPENKEGGRTERAAGPETPAPGPPSPAQTTQDVTAKIAPDSLTRARTGTGSLGQALRNLQQYLQSDNAENRHGGDTDQSADFQFDSMGVDFGPWLKQFKALIERNWLVPQAAMFQKGHVVLQFNVLRNGMIVNRRVAQPSAIEAFTTSAVNALILSNPAPALPPEYPADQVFFTVSFHYNEDVRNAP